MLIFLLYNKSSVVAEMGDRLATIDMGRRERVLCPFRGGGSWAPSNTMWPGPRSTSVQPFRHNRHGPKSGEGAVPLSRGAESPFNTMSSGPRPISAPNGSFIHPAIWPQQTRAENCWGGGWCAPFKGELGPPETMWPGPRPTPVPSGTLIHAAVWPQHGQNWGVLCPPPPFHLTCRLGRVYLRTKWHLNPSSRLAITDMDRK